MMISPCRIKDSPSGEAFTQNLSFELLRVEKLSEIANKRNKSVRDQRERTEESASRGTLL